MNPKKLGKLDNDYQEPWKLPLAAFIEEIVPTWCSPSRSVPGIWSRRRPHDAKQSA